MRVYRLLQITTVSAFFAVYAIAARAVDGVVEINHTCATQLGCFSGDTPGYPVTIDGSAGHSYRVTSDLIIPDDSTDGIEVDAASVSLDLNGFEIIRVGCKEARTVADCRLESGTGIGVHVTELDHSFFSIRNGTITGMRNQGAYLKGRGALVTGLRLRWNGAEGLRTAQGAVIDNSLASANGSTGIRTGHGSVLTNNTSGYNLGSGFLASSGSTLTDNSATYNTTRGFSTSQGATIRGNSAWANYSDGISTGYGSLVEGNTVYQNDGNGIDVQGRCNVINNVVSLNDGHGIDLGLNSVYRGNVIQDNVLGTVSGGTNMGDNFCDGNATCP